jgi:hypothetical protein
VSASIARLIHGPGQEREDARSYFSKIYAARSNIVHANVNRRMTDALIDEYGRAAVVANLKVLEILLTTHTHLVDMDSSARSNAVLMGSDTTGPAESS